MLQLTRVWHNFFLLWPRDNGKSLNYAMVSKAWDPLTLQQVGMRLSLTREGVRYIQDKGIGRLRNDNDALRRVLHPLRRAVAAEGGVADLHNITEEVFGRSPSDSPVDFYGSFLHWSRGSLR